jgi:hypothetical protein
MSAALEALSATGSPAAQASGMELVLEGLHLTRRLNRDRVETGYRYHA